MEIFNTTWPWYIAGPLIGLMVPALLLFDNKQFGISSTLRDFCAFVMPRSPYKYLKYRVKDQVWRNILVFGVFIGGFIAVAFGSTLESHISSATVADLTKLGLTDLSGFVPAELFNWKGVFSVSGLLFIVLGGFLIGFGTRWADGCTAGHAITGLSLLSLASGIAVVGFFMGGLLATHIIFPFIIN